MSPEEGNAELGRAFPDWGSRIDISGFYMSPKAAPDHKVSPSTVSKHLVEMLREADGVAELVQSEPLDTVAELANALSVSARCAGARQIAQAAEVVHHIASEHHAVTLAPAIRDLTSAIARTRSEYHLEFSLET
jgi:hypothetical protein